MLIKSQHSALDKFVINNKNDGTSSSFEEQNVLENELKRDFEAIR